MSETREGRSLIRDALIAWREDGVARPLIPIYRDVDGDGEPDFYGLDEKDELVLVPGVSIEDSVAASDGSGVEQGGDG